MIRYELYTWYVAEAVTTYFEGDADKLGRLMTGPMFPIRSMGELFGELDVFLMRWLGPHGHIFSADHQSGEISDTRERTMFAFRMLTPEFGDATSVFESGAAVAEHWRSWPATLVEFKASLPATLTYRAWIDQALRGRFAPDPKTFCLTYAALVDLALNPPVLPHQTSMRPPGMQSLDLNPVNRLFSGIATASSQKDSIPPIRDLARDYVPFVSAVCAANDWPTPFEMASRTADALPCDGKRDPLSDIFLTAPGFPRGYAARVPRP